MKGIGIIVVALAADGSLLHYASNITVTKLK